MSENKIITYQTIIYSTLSGARCKISLSISKLQEQVIQIVILVTNNQNF